MLEFAPVRKALLIVLLACAALAAGDTIRLKSGRTIIADHVREKDERIYYEVGENTYAIPKSLVESIDSSDPAASLKRPSSSGKSAPPVKTPATSPGFPGKEGALIRDGEVDTEALAALEQAGDDDAAAAAFFMAGRHEQGRGNRERARSYFERAVKLAPQNAEMLTQYASVLVQLGRAADGIPIGERATRLATNSAEAFTVLGFAYYSADRAAEAIGAWGRALQLRPDATVQSYLAKAQRELQAEAEFLQTDSGHFSVRYKGASTSDGIRDQVQQALEADYKALVQQLGIEPQASIAVTLYTDQAFFDVTQVPAWMGALNDGKLRIPIQGMAAVTPELRRVLRHELAHSFINQAARGRCPQWLNEGVAQLLEPKSLGATRGARLAGLYQRGAQVPVNRLEAPFLALSPVEAVLAYDEALAVAEYIRDTYGVDQLRAVLLRIGQGSSTESALRGTFHAGYSELEQQVGRYLTAKYGK